MSLRGPKTYEELADSIGEACNLAAGELVTALLRRDVRGVGQAHLRLSEIGTQAVLLVSEGLEGTSPARQSANFRSTSQGRGQKQVEPKRANRVLVHHPDCDVTLKWGEGWFAPPRCTCGVGHSEGTHEDD